MAQQPIAVADKIKAALPTLFSSELTDVSTLASSLTMVIELFIFFS
jgi:hypothetical protein